MKVVITQEGQLELDRLQFDLNLSIQRISPYIPHDDLRGLSHIVAMGAPVRRYKKDNVNKFGTYFPKCKNEHPFIELYLKNIFKHVKSSESFHQMVPIQESGLAKIIFHEVGHHVKEIRSHGIKQDEGEKFAVKYAREVFEQYASANETLIDKYFHHLKSLADEKGLSLPIILKMEEGWKRESRAAKGI